MIEYMYWISLPYATFGIFSRDDKTVYAVADIHKWAKGKELSYVLGYFRRKGAIILRRELLLDASLVQ